MTIEAKIICDSISSAGARLTTMQLRYPRFVHPEFLTHRKFGRNASSSRAIPVKRMIEDLRRDPALPVYWGANKPGMQAGEELTGDDLMFVKSIWNTAMEQAIKQAEMAMKFGLHKQIANRIIEPWAHINVVVTATDWENFYALRCHEDAQPEIEVLASAMRKALNESEPTWLMDGQWHLPYVTTNDWGGSEWDKVPPALDYLKKISVARCARVSYLTHDGRKSSIEEDLQLYEDLVVAQPLHASPAEHQATPDRIVKIERELWLDNTGDKTEHLGVEDTWRHPELHGNLTGWMQYRKMLPNEFVPG